MVHAVLARQLKKLGLSAEAPPSQAAWAELLGRVSRVYADNDQERYLRLRSQDLAEKELRVLAEDLARARDQAIALATVKTEFLANISHEIRTPLNGVIGMCSLLVETELGPEQRELAGGIRSSGEALLAVVNDVLDLSKLEAGRVELEQVEHSPRTIAEEVGDIVSAKAHESGLELIVDVAQDVPGLVLGDPTRLRQILLNLVNNAIKFTRQGEVVLRVWVEERPLAHSARLRFEVTDTGIGIPADRVSRLFQAFSQVDASTTRKYGGTGLGLAICKQLAEAMGGEIRVESELGSGSTFSLILELNVVPEEPQPDHRLADTSVLIVDANASSSAQLRSTLGAWGCRVSQAESAEQALKTLLSRAAQQRPIAVVVVSEGPHTEDVHALARDIAAHAELIGTRLVLSTQLSKMRRHPVEDRLRYAAMIGKPVKRDALRRAVASVVGLHVSAAAPPVRSTLSSKRELNHGRKVLVVDDNLVNQRVAGRMLELAGFTYETASDGQQALERLDRTRFDAVLMDCQMPVMDGFAATRELRRREPPALRTPVIALTASALTSDRDACLQAQMDAFLTKPIRSADLIRVLDACIRAARPSTASPRNLADEVGIKNLADEARET